MISALQKEPQPHQLYGTKELEKDGKGKIPRDMIISKGIDLHNSEIVDLDGDGDLDILGKPYDGDAPRLDIWLQK